MKQTKNHKANKKPQGKRKPFSSTMSAPRKLFSVSALEKPESLFLSYTDCGLSQSRTNRGIRQKTSLLHVSKTFVNAHVRNAFESNTIFFGERRCRAGNLRKKIFKAARGKNSVHVFFDVRPLNAD